MGGVERLFFDFIQDSRVHQNQHNHVLVGNKPIHPIFKIASKNAIENFGFNAYIAKFLDSFYRLCEQA